VGVAYGSDVDLVAETLMACAQTNPKVAKRPEPYPDNGPLQSSKFQKDFQADGFHP
jgi:small-conductance mechanosensitive channel